MLTPDDWHGDGGFTSYLAQRDKWRHFDPLLFDHLRELVQTENLRDVRGAETSAILPACRFAPGVLPDDAGGRVRYFESCTDIAQGCDLVFFDPDNGIEVKSKPVGTRDSSKYLYWAEIERFWQAGHSLLIYQHFPHVPRDLFIESKARDLIHKTRAPEVISFRTSHVVFFLVAQAERLDAFRTCTEKVKKRWRDQIWAASHPR
jgi:hypothetical protein